MKGKDWQHFVFDPKGRWIERMVRLAERRFPDAAVSGAAYNFAFEKISDNDWRGLESYTGRAQPGTYLTVVFCRHLEDYSRARFGRLRPPAWLNRMGELWTRVWQMLCLERMAPESIVDRLTARDVRPHAEVRRIIAVVRGRIPKCGQSPKEQTTGNPTELERQQDGSTPESELSQDDLAELLRAIRSFLSPKVEPVHSCGSDADTVAGSLVSRLAKLRDSLDLDDEERLILKLLYQDGFTAAAAAGAMKLPEHQVRRTRDRAVLRLRQALLAAGIGAELLSNE